MQVKKVVEQDAFSLEELRQIIRDGKAREVLTEGNQIVLEFDGKQTAYDVIGIDAEELAESELKHSVTLQAHELIEERPFDTKGRYGSNVWEKSELRAYLNSDEYKKRYGGELVDFLVPVLKENSNGRKTKDTFFLLSVEEFTEPDTPYEYYKEKHRRAKHAAGEINDWHFTRSAYRGYSCITWYVSSSGNVSYGDDANHSMRCAPACVIA